MVEKDPGHSREEATAIGHFQRVLDEPNRRRRVPVAWLRTVLRLKADGNELMLFPWGATQSARIEEHSTGAFADAVSRGSIALLTSYAHGDWDSKDLYAVMQCLSELDRKLFAIRVVSPKRFGHAKVAPERYREISLHYDLPRDLYALFTHGLNYSAAAGRWSPNDAGEAHKLHLRRVIESLDLGSGTGHVLDPGGGWGNLAEHVEQHTGNHVTTMTISHLQADFLRARFHGSSRVSVVEGDFRDSSQWPDVVDGVCLIESIEHLEDVDREVLFKNLRNRYPASSIVVQFTARLGPAARARNNSDTGLYGVVFPGPGNLPTLKGVAQLTHRSGYKITEVLNLTSEYAALVRSWYQRLSIATPEEARVDEQVWRMMLGYLAGTAAAFDKGSVGSFQLVLRPDDGRRGPKPA